MDSRERVDPQASLIETIETLVDRRLGNFHVSMPVKVTKDSDGHTVELQTLIKRVQRMADGTEKLVSYPPVLDAPVHFASGGGVTATHAVKEKDEGFIVVSSRSLDVWHQQGDEQPQVDARTSDLSDSFYISGVRSDPRKISDTNTEAHETRTDDGSHRTITHPKNGVKVTVNGGKQILDMDAKAGGLTAMAKKIAIGTSSGALAGAGALPSLDLNNQLKGLAARLAQSENLIAGLHKSVSKLRENAETVLPALAPLNLGTQVTAALNKLPSGLDAMIADVQGQAQAYLQKTVEQAMQKFLSPNLAGLTSLVGAVEGQIQALQAQIEQLVSQNPAVALADQLQRNIAAVLERGSSAEVTARQLEPFQAQLGVLMRGNPIISTVQSLRNQLTSLIQSAGAGLDFLGPQKRLVQGVTNSVTFSGGG